MPDMPAIHRTSLTEVPGDNHLTDEVTLKESTQNSANNGKAVKREDEMILG